MRDAAFPIVLIVLGAAWLFKNLGWMPDVHWLWILGLVGSGIAALAVDGITKSSVVAGPLLILAGALYFLHQYYNLGWRFMVPIMLVAAGTMMLVARSPAIPESRLGRRHDSSDPRKPSTDNDVHG